MSNKEEKKRSGKFIDQEEKKRSEKFIDQAAFILRSTRRRGLSGESILRDHLMSLGESHRIKGSSDFERVICSLEIYNSKNMDGMKVVSDYITRSEVKVEKPTQSGNNWWD